MNSGPTGSAHLDWAQRTCTQETGPATPSAVHRLAVAGVPSLPPALSWHLIPRPTLPLTPCLELRWRNASWSLPVSSEHTAEAGMENSPPVSPRTLSQAPKLPITRWDGSRMEISPQGLYCLFPQKPSLPLTSWLEPEWRNGLQDSPYPPFSRITSGKKGGWHKGYTWNNQARKQLMVYQVLHQVSP